MNLNNHEILSANLKVLIKKYPDFNRDIIEKFLPSSIMEVHETALGQPTAKIDGNWIHSSRNPEKEAAKLAGSGLRLGRGLCMIYSFGLGYHVEAVMKLFPELSILIVEPDPPLFLEALGLRDFSGIIASERTGFLLDIKPEVIPGILNSSGKIDIQTLKLRALYDRNLDYYEAVDEEVKAYISKKETNMNTLNRFGKAWVRNLFRNAPLFGLAGDTGVWYNKFSEIPALVLAAGPSLDEILPHLSELHKKYVIICVDTALRAVMGSGAVPDFIVVVDPQYLNTRHLDNCLDSELLNNNSILISESSTHPLVFRKSKLPVFFFKSIFPLGKMLEKHAGIYSELGAGGSVSTTAWDLARKLGCSEIYTAGLDLGFPDSNTHCRDSLSPLVSHLLANRFKPVDTINYGLINDAAPFREENNEGGLTLTDRRLIIYKWWFEEQIRSQGGNSAGPQVKLQSTSPRGIRIDGMELTTAEILLRKEEKRTQINSIKEAVTGSLNKTDVKQMTQIRQTIESISAECLRLEEICSEALQILAGIEQDLNGSASPAGFKRLSELDSLISASPSKELTAFIIQPVLNEIIDNNAPVIENSRNLYQNLFTACSFHRKHAEQSIKTMIRT